MVSVTTNTCSDLNNSNLKQSCSMLTKVADTSSASNTTELSQKSVYDVALVLSF